MLISSCEDPLFAATQIGTGEAGASLRMGSPGPGGASQHPSGPTFEDARAAAQMRYFNLNQHSLRDLLAQLRERVSNA